MWYGLGMNKINFFGRIGTASIVRERQNEIKCVGGTVERDQYAGTVVAKVGEEIAFKALRKGGPGQPWIVLYNPAFYPQN